MSERRLEPIKRLALAMIKQSIRDVRNYKQRINNKKMPTWNKNIATINHDEAMKWFNERSDEPFGYGWCLYVTGLNPRDVRKAIS